MSTADRLGKILESQGAKVEDWKPVKPISKENSLDMLIKEESEAEHRLRVLYDDLDAKRERGREGITRLLETVGAGENDYRHLFLMAVDVLADTLAQDAIRNQIYDKIGAVRQDTGSKSMQ